jgi:predicted small metal-binding protein
MKTLSCQDVSGLSCPFVAKGETEEAVIQQLMDHAKAEHPEESAKMMEGKTPEEVNEMLKSKIKEEAVETGAPEAGTPEETGTTEPAAEPSATEETNPTEPGSTM